MFETSIITGIGLIAVCGWFFLLFWHKKKDETKQRITSLLHENTLIDQRDIHYLVSDFDCFMQKRRKSYLFHGIKPATVTISYIKKKRRISIMCGLPKIPSAIFSVTNEQGNDNILFTGDDAFDQRFNCQGDDYLFCLLLSPEVRNRLVESNNSFFMVRITQMQVRIDASVDFITRNKTGFFKQMLSDCTFFSKHFSSPVKDIHVYINAALGMVAHSGVQARCLLWLLDNTLNIEQLFPYLVIALKTDNTVIQGVALKKIREKNLLSQKKISNAIRELLYSRDEKIYTAALDCFGAEKKNILYREIARCKKEQSSRKFSLDRFSKLHFLFHKYFTQSYEQLLLQELEEQVKIPLLKVFLIGQIKESKNSRLVQTLPGLLMDGDYTVVCSALEAAGEVGAADILDDIAVCLKKNTRPEIINTAKKAVIKIQEREKQRVSGWLSVNSGGETDGSLSLSGKEEKSHNIFETEKN